MKEGGNLSDIVGTWYATTPTGKGSLTLTFNSNKTGTLDYEWNGINYTRAIYTSRHTYGGGKIKCKGTMVHSSDGTSSEEMTFEYSGGRITGGRWATGAPYQKR